MARGPWLEISHDPSRCELKIGRAARLSELITCLLTTNLIRKPLTACGLPRTTASEPATGHCVVLSGSHTLVARSPSKVLFTMARPTRRLGNLPAEATSFIGRRRELADSGRSSARRAWSASSDQAVSAKPASRCGLRQTSAGASKAACGWSNSLKSGIPDCCECRPRGLGSAGPGGDRTAGLLLSYLRDKKLLLVVDNCEHPARGSGSARVWRDQSCSWCARDRHQPRAAVGAG